MKRITGILFIAILAGLFFSPTQLAKASPTHTSIWSSSIVVYNPSDTDTTEYNIVYYGSDDPNNVIPSSLRTLIPHESVSILVGSTILDENFKGGAVISSDREVIAIYRQSTPETSMIVYSSFTIGDAGAGKFYIPVARRNADSYSSRISVQNLHTAPASVSFQFFSNSGTYSQTITPASNQVYSNASKVFDLASNDFSALGDNFIGSVVITTGGSEKIIAAVQDFAGASSQTYAYQGEAAGNSEVFIPNAACNFGRSQLSTELLVQNTGSGTLNSFGIEYFDANGTLSGAHSNLSGLNLAPGDSISVQSCNAIAAGSSYSALVTSSQQPVSVVVRTTDNSGFAATINGFSKPGTGWLGNDNKYRMVLPYGEWTRSDNSYQTYIAVMNASDSAATDVKAVYFYENGTRAVSHTLATASNPLPVKAKRTTNANAAPGLLNPQDQYFKGAVVIESNVPIVAVARVQRTLNNPTGGLITEGDDYGAIPYAKPAD